MMAVSGRLMNPCLMAVMVSSVMMMETLVWMGWPGMAMRCPQWMMVVSACAEMAVAAMVRMVAMRWWIRIGVLLFDSIKDILWMGVC